MSQAGLNDSFRMNMYASPKEVSRQHITPPILPAEHGDFGTHSGREVSCELGDDVQRNNAEDKYQRQHQHDNGIDLQARGFVRVES